MSLNQLPGVLKQSILNFLPVHTPMQSVSKEWENIFPNEGHLDLSDCEFTDYELENIIRHFQGKGAKIVSIDLSESRITDAGLELLALSGFPIQRLNLEECRKCTNRGLRHLSALPLIDLDLSFCKKIDDDGVKHLAECHLLTQLDLSLTSVTDKGLYHLAHLRLTKLTLKQCDKIPSFLRTFPRILFPRIPPEDITDSYTESYMEILPEDREIDIQDLRKKFAEQLPPLHPPSELDIIKSYIGSDVQSTLTADVLSPHLQTLPSFHLRVYSTYVDSEFRSQLFEEVLLPLTQPLPTIYPLISPLHTFAKKEMDADPKFAIYLNPPTPENASTSAQYDPEDGVIEVFMEENEVLDTTCLLHELGHKAYEKLRWENAIHLYQPRVAADIYKLERDRWRHCHPVIAEIFKNAHKGYRHDERFEECLMRMPEIITRIAQENPKRSFAWIENCIKKDLPNLYFIYKEAFIPHLKKYNKQKI